MSSPDQNSTMNHSDSSAPAPAPKAFTPSITSKALIITYYWPPSGGAGVQRWLKFSKYLPEFGWEPIILTVDPEYAAYPQKDDGLLNEISPDLEIVYTKTSNGIFSLYKKLTGGKEVPYGGFANEANPGLIQKFFRLIRGNFFLPDARIGWNRFALKAALKIIKEQEIDLVITTSPPHSTQLIGLKIKKKLNIKWIADLRDPWADIYYSGQMYQSTLARKINSCMEKQTLNRADRVIATCNSTRDMFRTKLSLSQAPEKIVTITNGFDPDDFNYSHLYPDKFTITYLGTFAKNYDITVLIRALDYCASKNVTGLELCFIGKTDEVTVKILKENKNILLQLIPYVEHKKALEYLAKSAAFLLVVPSGKKTDEMIPGKLFEYLASERPIIGIGPLKSDVAEILSETGGGRMFDKAEYIELGNYILEIVNNFNNGRFENHPVKIEQYSRRNLTNRINDLIKSI
jgi:glycosyltransferase involved in cell wall biosynthesis